MIYLYFFQIVWRFLKFYIKFQHNYKMNFPNFLYFDIFLKLSYGDRFTKSGVVSPSQMHVLLQANTL